MPEPSGPGSAAVAARLGRAAASCTWDRLPTNVRTRAVDVFLDTIAVQAVGSDEPEHRRLQELVTTGGGPATVIGTARGTAPAEATFLNGTLPTVHQLDEGYRVSRGHPSVHLVPPALALGEAGHRPTDVLAALVAGYEIAARVGASLGGTRPEMHPHGNWGVVGAAVTVAMLLGGPDPDTLATAVDLAAGIAGRHDRRAATAGAGVHHLWLAVGAQTGFGAGAAAAAGFSAVPGTLVDFLLPNSGMTPDVGLLTTGFGDDDTVADWTITEQYVKFWPACGHTHTAIGAAAALVTEHGVDPSDVVLLDVATFRAAATLDDPQPANTLAARYSIPAVVAATLLDGDLGLESLSDERLREPEFAALAARVRVRHSPQHDAGYPEHGRPLTMTATLCDGRTLRVDRSFSLGDPEQPADRDTVHAKASRLLSHRFGDHAAEQILDAVLGLAQAPDFHALTTALRSAATHDETGTLS